MISIGETRSRICRTHALIAPDSHVIAPLARWDATSGIVLISPAMGARFCQYIALLEDGSASAGPAPGVQRFVYMMEGQISVETGDGQRAVDAGQYAWLPPDSRLSIQSSVQGRAVVFEKPYTPRAGCGLPGPVFGTAEEKPETPFFGDPNARLRTLLPDEPAFDMAINLFTYDPGATLPFVEVHVMEHGLIFLSGGGVYRLDESWYVTGPGDVIWMGPYCPQWFCAAGKTPASYLYYKDMNRDPLAEGVL